MNKRPIPHCLMLLAVIFLPQALRPQEAGKALQLLTDRSIYITGEVISLSVFRAGTPQDAAKEDKVLYCELITPDGDRLTGGKFPLEDGRGSGSLSIPEAALTGNYYLKCYTRSMRNEPLSRFTFRPVTIINPYRDEVLAGQPGEYPAGTAPGSYGIALSGLNESYRPGSTVHLTIDPGNASSFPVKTVLSVVPEASVRSVETDSIPDLPGGSDEVCYPENRGISLSGTLFDKGKKIPLPGVLINLSVLGDRDCMARRTDSAGRFAFALPAHDGYRDIFLCAEELPGTTPAILVDNDFDHRALQLPPLPFSLDESERETAWKMAVNAKISAVYETGEADSTSAAPVSGKPFYGEPAEIIRLDQYIELPTLEDYFNELPYGVNVRKEQGIKEFRFYTTQVDMTIYDPLILIDFVAVNDAAKVLSMSPREIERIELVNEPYIKGGITYGGVISFVSKNNDFAGIDLPASGTFINYQFFSAEMALPQEQEPDEQAPDSRNTVYWDPDLLLETSRPTQITFPAPATPGRYAVILRGWLENGKEFQAADSFIVK